MSAPIERNEEKRPRAKSDIWQRLREYLSSDNSQKRDLPGVAFLASQAFNILAADLARAEIALAKPELVIELDMSGIELWEFWRGVDAADLGYEQSQDAINSFMGEE
jgi:hypothetical protein